MRPRDKSVLPELWVKSIVINHIHLVATDRLTLPSDSIADTLVQ